LGRTPKTSSPLLSVVPVGSAPKIALRAVFVDTLSVILSPVPTVPISIFAAVFRTWAVARRVRVRGKYLSTIGTFPAVFLRRFLSPRRIYSLGVSGFEANAVTGLLLTRGCEHR